MAIRNEMKLRLMTTAPLARAYEGDAGRSLAVQYESLDPEKLHADILHWLPRLPASVIDIGAGSGRDAAWFASKGYSVLAVEPSATMREEGRRRHPDSGITWIDDSLPGLAGVYRLGASFDVAMLSAVWMHVPPRDRKRAFRKIVNLLKPNGMIVMCLKIDLVEADRGMHPVSADEVGRLARDNGAYLVSENISEDRLGRRGTRWSTLVLKLPDDGTKAFPQLRQVILNDAKNTTYKLGLLQSVLRAADGSQGLADTGDGDMVRVPLGLVALNWLRLYKPLIEANLPQAPKNQQGAEGLSFASEGWKILENDRASDFRPGAFFGGVKAQAVHRVLNKIADNIVKNPAKFMTYSNAKESDPIMPAEKFKTGKAPGRICMDAEYLWSFGVIQVPVTIWRVLANYGAWIEPALVNEWGQKIKKFAQNQGRPVNPGVLAEAMHWNDPSREVGFVRRRVDELMAQGTVYCVWTGKKLSTLRFEIDHCMPWAAWPCGDLWNLMPTSPTVNRKKSHRLPAARTLERSSERILDWWNRAWPEGAEHWERFLTEAKASLPMLPKEPDLYSVFAGVLDRRFSIKANQGVEEWVQ